MIDLATLKDWLAVEDDEHDALLTDLEARAVAFLEQQTGRHYGESESTTEYLLGTGGRVLWLREKPVGVGDADPVVTVAREVIEDDVVTWEEVEATKYQIRDHQLVHNTYWCCGETYRATYNAGYVEGEEPDDIKQAVMDLCALKYRARKAAGFQSESIGGYSYTTADIDAIPGLRETISQWRWVNV